MDQGQLLFYERLRRLGEKHRALARGYRARMRPDGLIVLTPRRSIGPISPRPLALVLVAFVLFKAFLVASLGSEGYGDRLTALDAGGALDRAGAVVMQRDPVSDTIAAAMTWAQR